MLMLRRRKPKGPRIHTQAYNHEARQRKHKTPSARKVQEDRDNVKEKHSMEREKTTKERRGMDATHPPSHPHTLHTLSL